MLNNLKFPFSIIKYKFQKLNKEKKSKEVAPQNILNF